MVWAVAEEVDFLCGELYKTKDGRMLEYIGRTSKPTIDGAMEVFFEYESCKLFLMHGDYFLEVGDGN